MVAVLSKAFNLAIRWKWRTDNPARGIEAQRRSEARALSFRHRDRFAVQGAE
jgi:hypothetical protein